MTTINFTAHFYVKRGYSGEPEYSMLSYKTDGLDPFWGPLIGEAPVSFEVPADFNAVAVETACIEAEKTLALANYQRTVADCNERLAKLRAITNEVVS